SQNDILLAADAERTAQLGATHTDDRFVGTQVETARYRSVDVNHARVVAGNRDTEFVRRSDDGRGLVAAALRASSLRSPTQQGGRVGRRHAITVVAATGRTGRGARARGALRVRAVIGACAAGSVRCCQVARGAGV